ncbi:hypothetical protein ABZT03_43055, partial [Streptomyces sp. NPDC005574]
MTTQRLPFPVPDDRAHYFVTCYADMHDLVEDLVVPDGVPEAAATVLRTARELLRQSYYCYEFSTVAVMHSLRHPGRHADGLGVDDDQGRVLLRAAPRLILVTYGDMGKAARVVWCVKIKLAR